MHNIISQRAYLIFKEEETKGGGWFKKVVSTTKAVFKEAKQATKDLLRDSRAVVNETLNDRKPGFLIVSPEQCEFQGLPESAHVQLNVGLGPNVQHTALVPGNRPVFQEKLLFTRDREAAVCIEVWYKPTPADQETYLGTAVLRLETIISSGSGRQSIPVLRGNQVGVVSVEAVFISTKSVGSVH